LLPHPTQLVGISMMTFRGISVCVVCVAVMLMMVGFGFFTF